MIGVLIVLSGVLFGTIIIGNSLLKKQSQKLLAAKLESESLEEQQSSLIKAKRDIENYTELEQIAKSVVPQDKEQAKVLREIKQIADRSGIKIRSISFPASSLGTKAAPVPKSDDSKKQSSEKTTPTKSNTPLITQAKPVEGLSGVYSLEMNIIPETSEDKAINYYQFLDFLSRLENNRRTAQVTRIKISPVSTKQNIPYIDFSLTINIFLKP